MECHHSSIMAKAVLRDVVHEPKPLLDATPNVQTVSKKMFFGGAILPIAVFMNDVGAESNCAMYVEVVIFFLDKAKTFACFIY
jgi:hypothetical protein